MSRVAVVPSARALVLVASLVFLAVQGDDVVSCQNPSQQSGTCIVITDCPEMMALLLKTDITEDENEFLNNSKCRAHDYLLYMCCPSEPVRLPKPAVVQEEGPDDAPIPANPLIPTLGECGKYIENKTGEGESMDLTEFPWLALLQYTEPTEKAFLCGGSLISARYVLTAAHCVTKPLVTSTNRLTSVRLGEYNKTSERDCVGNVCSDNPLDIPVEHSLAHKDFNFSDRSNDIALVRLSRSVEYSAWVAPICLPLLSDVITRKNRVSEEVTAGGWGYTEIDGSSDVKMKIKVSVVSRDSCANVYRYVNERVLNTQLCARRREETCRGDFGAPLVALEEQGADVNWFLAGIVSDGTLMCGMWTWPWLIIDVTKYGAWIARNIKP